MDLSKIKLAENSMDYWKEDALYWWRRYCRNRLIINRLRKQNRRLRAIISDYVQDK